MSNLKDELRQHSQDAFKQYRSGGNLDDQVNKFLGYQSEASVLPQNVTEELSVKISQLIFTDDEKNGISIFIMRIEERELLLEYFLYDTLNKNILLILHTIQYYGLKNKAGEKSVWSSLTGNNSITEGFYGTVLLAEYGNRFGGQDFDIDQMLFPTEKEFIRVGKDLIKLGHDVQIKNGGIASEQGIKEYVDDIHSFINDVGGGNVIKNLFKELGVVYSATYRRYFFSKAVSTTGLNFQPQIPVNLIVNYACQYLAPDAVTKKDEDEKRAFFKKCVDVGAYYGVQQANIFETMFIDKNSLPNYLINTSIYDSLFRFSNYDFSMGIDIAEGLFDENVDLRLNEYLPVTIKDIIKVFRAVDTIVASRSDYIIFTIQSIRSITPDIDSSTIELALKSQAFDVNEVNQGYHDPTDFSKVNLYLKPLIQLDDTSFLIISPPLASQSVYEGLVSLLRENGYKEIDNKLGEYTELFLRKCFDQRSINYYSGDYEYTLDKKYYGECDFLIETDKGIILLEVKKKALTRSARSGVDVALMSDLAKSLLSSQTQLLRTEFVLCKDRLISINDGVQVKDVHLNNREIVKVSVSLLDFLGFQDKNAVYQVISNIVQSEWQVNSADKEFQSMINNINKEIKRFTDIWSAYSAVDPDIDLWKSIFNSHFLNVPQLLILLEDCDDGNDLFEVFKKLSILQSGSGDLIFEYLLHKQ